jgi:hypothetical protein
MPRVFGVCFWLWFAGAVTSAIAKAQPSIVSLFAGFIWCVCAARINNCVLGI